MGSLLKLREEFKSKKIGYEEYYKDLLPKAKKKNDATNALLEIFEEDCLEKAKAFDQKAPTGALAGIPIGIKDIISIKGQKLNAASRILEGYRAPRSATVSEKLEKDGALFLGRANCDEFAMGSTNEQSAFGGCNNPYALDHVAGGSSGGSAAFVAAKMGPASLGTDTGGSIRLPASFCGIVGLRPTYGRVSRSGVIAFASSLDQVGPFAEDAADCAEILQSIAGRDQRDATSMPVPVPNYADEISKYSLKGKRIGLPKEFFQADGIEPEVQQKISLCIENFKKAGAEFVEVSIPSSDYGIAAYYLVATAEASSNLARYDGIRYGHRSEIGKNAKELIVNSRSEGFGEEVKRRIMLGCFSLSAGYYDAYYAKAQFTRSKIQQEYLEAFKEVDLILTPTSPSVATKTGEKSDDPLKAYLMDIFTVGVNLAGLCGISFPVGVDSKGLPIGAQLIGGPFEEHSLLGAVASYEKEFEIEKGELQC